MCSSRPDSHASSPFRLLHPVSPRRRLPTWRRRAKSSTAAGSRGSGSGSERSSCIGAYLIAFVAGNDEEASVDFVFGQARTSLIWVILLSLLAGLVGGVLLSQLHRRRQARRSEASIETPSPISDGDA